MKSIGVLGGGSWGTALAILLSRKSLSVKIWFRDLNQVEYINKYRENKKYLPKVKLPKNLYITNNVEETIQNKDIILLAVPTHGIREILEKYGRLIRKDQEIGRASCRERR